MRLAYLILAHNTPKQLARLAQKISDTGVDIYIHVDKKADIQLFTREIQIPQVSFVKKREDVHWGGYSIIRATLNGLQEIANAGIDYCHITLLSGQDYPLKSNHAIKQFFAANAGEAFMLYESIENEWQEALPRLNRYFLTDYTFPGSTKIEGWINKLLPARKPPPGLVFVGRSQWFSITLEQLKYILATLRPNSKLEKYFRFTWGSDEFVFQTILYNSPFKEQMVNNNLRFTDWSARGVSPKILRMEDAASLSLSAALFARKFDAGTDAGILDWLDEKTR